MLTSWLLAALHLVALAVGFAAIWTRARALGAIPAPPAFRRAFVADAAWGVSAVLWIGTGLLRAFAGFEKGTAYYLGNHVFLTKMALLVVVLLLEILPMVTLLRWRLAIGRGEEVDATPARRLALMSYVQAGLVLAMVFAATAMARGIGGPE